MVLISYQKKYKIISLIWLIKLEKAILVKYLKESIYVQVHKLLFRLNCRNQSHWVKSIEKWQIIRASIFGNLDFKIIISSKYNEMLRSFY